MSIGGAIKTLLDLNANIVSSGASIYPVRARSNNASLTNPTIIYNSAVDPEDDKDGAATIDHSPIQIDVYGTSYDNSIEIAGYVRTALDRISGTYDSVVIDTIIFTGQDDFYDNISKADRVLMNFRIRIKT
jgi:hypothetical protein